MVARLVHRLKTLVSSSTAAETYNTTPHAPDSPQTDDRYMQFLHALLDIDDLPPEYRDLVETQRKLLAHIDNTSPHWKHVAPLFGAFSDDTSLTPRQELRETEHLARRIQDAFDADYKHYARGHQLATDLLAQYTALDTVDADATDPIRHQITIFDICQEFAMTNSWVASIRIDGLRLMFFKPDDELGNLALDLEVKRRTSSLILATTTVVETVGHILLEVHGDPANPNERLTNIIDKLRANELITAEEAETLHAVRKMRNRIAHDMVERTTLEWVEDFQELVDACFAAVEAVSYPLEARLETELPPAVAAETIDSLIPDETDESDWETALRER